MHEKSKPLKTNPNSTPLPLHSPHPPKKCNETDNGSTNFILYLMMNSSQHLLRVCMYFFLARYLANSVFKSRKHLVSRELSELAFLCSPFENVGSIYISFYYLSTLFSVSFSFSTPLYLPGSSQSVQPVFSSQRIG